MGSEAIQQAGVPGWERKRTAVEYCVLRLRRRVSGAGLYILVIERAADNTIHVRGLLSRTRLLRQLGAQSSELRGITQ
jgi:hypothetical protein